MNRAPIPRRRRFVLVWLALALIAALPPVAAQTLRIAAVVNNDVISVYDVNERIRFIMFSAGIPDTPEARRQIAPQVIRTLIDERLEMQEAKRLNISIDQAEYQDTVTRLESQNHLPPGKLYDFISEKGINPATLESQIRAALTWSRVVRRRAQGHVTISPEEVQDARDRIVESLNKPSHLVADIFLAVDAPEDDPTVRANIERLRSQLVAGAAFVPLARQFSQDASAQEGGDLGWVPQGQLDPELDRALDRMKPGDLSEPIRTAAGYYLLFLRETRAPGSSGNADVSLTRVVFPSAPGNANSAEIAQRVAQTVSGCEDLARAAREANPAATVATAKVKLSEMAPELRDLAATLPVGKASNPTPIQNGVQVVMVCERQGGEAAAPSPEEVERMLTAEKLEQFSRRLLRDLRQSAFVDIRV